MRIETSVLRSGTSSLTSRGLPRQSLDRNCQKSVSPESSQIENSITVDMNGLNISCSFQRSGMVVSLEESKLRAFVLPVALSRARALSLCFSFALSLPFPHSLPLSRWGRPVTCRKSRRSSLKRAGRSSPTSARTPPPPASTNPRPEAEGHSASSLLFVVTREPRVG